MAESVDYGGRPVLELRVHGITNTPPEVTLGVDRTELIRSESAGPGGGDALGSFWISREPSPGTPSDVRREAYSWGNMARSGGGALLVGRFFVELAWLLILPFALCNLAYWTREIGGTTRRAVGRAKRMKEWDWDAGRGGAAVRLFAVALTALAVTSLLTVVLDLVGTQCVITGEALCGQIPSAFNWLAAFDWHQRMAVLSIVPVAGIALLFAITFRSHVGFAANTAVPSAHDGAVLPRAATLRSPRFWTLARVGPTTEYLHFAAGLEIVAAVLAWDHVFGKVPGCRRTADGFDLECVTTLRKAMFTTVGSGFATAFFVGAFLLLVLTLVMAGWAVSDTTPKDMRRGRARALALLVLAGTAYLATALLVGFDASCAPKTGCLQETHLMTYPPDGLTTTPVLIVAMALLIALAALGWRRGVPAGFTWPVLSLALAAFVAFTLQSGGMITPRGSLGVSGWAAEPGHGWVLPALAGVSGGAVLLNLLAVAAWPALFGDERKKAGLRFAGWGGTGPGVVLLLSLGAAMTLASLLVSGVARWLSGATPHVVWRAIDPNDEPKDLPTTTVITAPPPYASFSVAFLGGVIIALVAAIWILLSVMGHMDLLVTPRLTGPTPTAPAEPVLEGLDLYRDSRRRRRTRAEVRGAREALEAEVRAAMREQGFDAARLAQLQDRLAADDRGDELLSERRLATFVHRAEPLLGILATLFAAAVTVSLVIQLPAHAAARHPALSFFVGAVDTGALIMGLIFLAGAGAIVAGLVRNSAGTERPLGVLWDLMCFLPRAGHPLGPQCYGERVVPELVHRIQSWLHPVSPDAEPAAERKVVISAHSMGVVLAVGVVLSSLMSDEDRDRIGLLSYGAQVRAYFGRFFPDVFGPGELGTRGIRRPLLASADPWERQVEADQSAATVLEEGVIPKEFTAVSALTSTPASPSSPSYSTRWINLWRRTDLLGFPVHSYLPASFGGTAGATGGGADENPIDRGAQERDPSAYQWNIQTHSYYPHVPQYDAAFAELLGRIP